MKKCDIHIKTIDPGELGDVGLPGGKIDEG